MGHARRTSPDRAPDLLGGEALTSVAAVAVTFAAPASQARAQGRGLRHFAKGERRDIVLSDGTQVALNAASSLSVVMKRDRRELTLASGEAAFKVVHDPARPFVVHLGDRDAARHRHRVRRPALGTG